MSSAARIRQEQSETRRDNRPASVDVRCNFGHRSSTSSGNDTATPASGRYSRCSKMKSAIDMMLEVGDNVRRNQKIENVKTGNPRRTRHAKKTRADKTRIEIKTAGSKSVDE